MTIVLGPQEVDNTSVRAAERASIRAFVEGCAEHLGGRVLDYGCGQQPYRGIVEAAGGEYLGFDNKDFPGNVSERDIVDRGPGFERVNAILCTQVLQYVPLYGYLAPVSLTLAGVLDRFESELRHGGHLILTYPTTWAEVEPVDLTRFTRAGMERLLVGAGFTILRHDERAAIVLGGFRLPLGYGVLARA